MRICKYTPVCICVRMRQVNPSKIYTPEYIYTRVFLAHTNWTLASKHMSVEVRCPTTALIILNETENATPKVCVIYLDHITKKM